MTARQKTLKKFGFEWCDGKMPFSVPIGFFLLRALKMVIRQTGYQSRGWKGFDECWGLLSITVLASLSSVPVTVAFVDIHRVLPECLWAD